MMTSHFDDLPSRRITISTTFHYEREVVPVSRHEREVLPVSLHERETVTTSHYDDFALRPPSISTTSHYDETFLTRSPLHKHPTCDPEVTGSNPARAQCVFHQSWCKNTLGVTIYWGIDGKTQYFNFGSNSIIS